MNKIYKLVWSKTRNMYVAVCEFAKSHSKLSRRSLAKKVAASLLLSMSFFNFYLEKPSFAWSFVIGVNNSYVYPSLNPIAYGSGTDYSHSSAVGFIQIPSGKKLNMANCTNASEFFAVAGNNYDFHLTDNNLDDVAGGGQYDAGELMVYKDLQTGEYSYYIEIPRTNSAGVFNYSSFSQYAGEGNPVVKLTEAEVKSMLNVSDIAVVNAVAGGISGAVSDMRYSDFRNTHRDITVLNSDSIYNGESGDWTRRSIIGQNISTGAIEIWNYDGDYTSIGNSTVGKVYTMGGGSGSGSSSSGGSSDVHLYAGSGTAANAATSNGATKLILTDGTTVKNALTVKGTGGTTVTSDANGVITINSATVSGGDGSVTAMNFSDFASTHTNIQYLSEETWGHGDSDHPTYMSAVGKNIATGAIEIFAAGANGANGLISDGGGFGYVYSLAGAAEGGGGGTVYTAGNGISIADAVISAKAANGINVTSSGIGVKAGTNVTVDSNGVNVAGSGSVASGNTGLISGGTAYSELRPSSNGSFVKSNQTTAQNLTALDTATKNGVKDLSVSGRTITITKGDGTTSTITTQDNDTHYTTHMYVGDGTASNKATTNGNTKISLYDNSTARESVTIKGTGATTVVSDANGVITVNSTDTDTKYTAGNGLLLSGTTFSAKAGTNVTVDSNGISVAGNGSVASGNMLMELLCGKLIRQLLI